MVLINLSYLSIMSELFVKKNVTRFFVNYDFTGIIKPSDMIKENRRWLGGKGNSCRAPFAVESP